MLSNPNNFNRSVIHTHMCKRHHQYVYMISMHRTHAHNATRTDVYKFHSNRPYIHKYIFTHALQSVYTVHRHTHTRNVSTKTIHIQNWLSHWTVNSRQTYPNIFIYIHIKIQNELFQFSDWNYIAGILCGKR